MVEKLILLVGLGVGMDVIFQDRAMAELIFCKDVLYDVQPINVDKFLLLHFGYSLVLSVSVSVYVNLTPYFSNFVELR